jgi:hypothetical protein
LDLYFYDVSMIFDDFSKMQGKPLLHLGPWNLTPGTLKRVQSSQICPWWRRELAGGDWRRRRVGKWLVFGLGSP